MHLFMRGALAGLAMTGTLLSGEAFAQDSKNDGIVHYDREKMWIEFQGIRSDVPLIYCDGQITIPLEKQAKIITGMISNICREENDEQCLDTNKDNIPQITEVKRFFPKLKPSDVVKAISKRLEKLLGNEENISDQCYTYSKNKANDRSSSQGGEI